MPLRLRYPAAACAALAVAGCGAPSSVGIAQPQAQIAALSVAPVAGGYLRGDSSGLRLWGAGGRQFDVVALDAAGNPLTGSAAPKVTVTSASPQRLSVRPGDRPGRFRLQAAVAAQHGSACPACKVVTPGIVELDVVATPARGRGASLRVPVTVDHKIVYVSLNPFPNPSIGGSDAVVQYDDDNAAPSVIWDDFYLKNTSAIAAVGGLAVGAAGTLYVANLGSGTPGTVTEYPSGATSPVPVKTLTAPKMMGPQAVAVDASGDVFVADNFYETVTRFPAGGAKAVTLLNNWPAGAGLYGIAADRRGNLDLAMTDVGFYSPKTAPNVGTLAVMRAAFESHSTPVLQITSDAKNGVNEPYGVAVAADGTTYVVNDYVSIVEAPPGPGPVHSTLTRYANGLGSATVLPDATIDAGLAWPTSVAVDLAGTVYVGNNTPAVSGPMPFYLREYPAHFASGAKPLANVDLTKGLPAAYASAYLNVQGIAVYPGPLQH